VPVNAAVHDIDVIFVDEPDAPHQWLGVKYTGVPTGMAST
jgi:hypothetical protein